LWQSADLGQPAGQVAVALCLLVVALPPFAKAAVDSMAIAMMEKIIFFI
jgi:hypothetical protein